MHTIQYKLQDYWTDRRYRPIWPLNERAIQQMMEQQKPKLVSMKPKIITKSVKTMSLEIIRDPG